MKAQGLGATGIAKALKIGRASVYRLLGAGSSPRTLTRAVRPMLRPVDRPARLYSA
jgi:hypothetical protein